MDDCASFRLARWKHSRAFINHVLRLTLTFKADFRRPSNRLGAFSRDQDCQYSGGTANASRDRYERFRHGRILLGQCLKARAEAWLRSL
jgi:hypothetical protein